MEIDNDQQLDRQTDRQREGVTVQASGGEVSRRLECGNKKEKGK